MAFRKFGLIPRQKTLAHRRANKFRPIARKGG